MDPNNGFDSSAAQTYVAGLTGDPASTTGFEIVFNTYGSAGPVVYIDSHNGALQYVKISFVYSVMDTYFKPDQSKYPHYPEVYQ